MDSGTATTEIFSLPTDDGMIVETRPGKVTIRIRSGGTKRKCPKSNRDQLMRLAVLSAPTRVIDHETMKLRDVVDDVGLSIEQRVVYDMAIEGKSFFFTGAAGTGKSHTLRTIIKKLNRGSRAKGIFVTASTGIAACNIGGCTVHAFAGIRRGEGTVNDLVNLVNRDRNAKKRWKDVRVLIIEEISMLGAELFDKIDGVARRMKKEPTKPFGGIQVILCGDFFQLPPVNDAPTFMASCWNQIISESVELCGNFRQSKDFEFAQVLNQLRFGIISEHVQEALNACMTKKDDVGTATQMTILYPHRVDVDKKNQAELSALPGLLRVFLAQDTGNQQLLRNLDKCPAPKELNLKEGALVVLLRNLDFDRGLVNGSQGVVTGFTGNVPIVQFTNGERELIKEAEWEVKVGADTVSRHQIPLMLGYALTIHKSQGLTLDRLEMKLADVFAPGQAYVALSRATTAAGLHLINYNPYNIRAHPDVVEFHKTMLRTRMGATETPGTNKKPKVCTPD